MKKKRSKLISMLLTLVMTLSLVPAMGVTASAAEPTWETVTTYEKFAEAMTANGQRNVRLGADIDTGPLNSDIGLLDTLAVKGQKQLDLNGHTLRLFTQKSALGDLIEIKNSSLTLSDSSTAKTGRILGVTSTDSNVLISVWQNGKFTMNGGKLEVEAGKFRDVLWRRTIDCRYGGEVVINGGTLYVPPKTYERYENQLLDQFLDEFDDLRNGSCGYTLIADNDCKVTITGGTFQGPVRMNASNSKWNKTTSRVIITGGTFENNVVLNGAGSKTGDGKVTLAEIKGGTFLGKVQAWAAASFDSSFSTPEVVISGGDFSKEFWLRPKFPLVNDKEPEGMAYYVAAKLNGGTFHEKFSADKSSKNYKYSGAAVKQRLNASEIYQLADKLLGQNAIQTGNGTFAAQDYSSYNKYITNYRKSEHDSGGYAFIIKAVNSQPTTIIPNAWGMKSVTLDGDEINYAKDWKGTVERMDNSTAHTLKFEWYPLASELVNAGYSYNAKCEHYVSGSTAVQQTDTIAADKTSHTVTIPAGADPKVYSYDLQLNLEKNGSNVGIFTNEHIVKLVVNPAPVVTEIANAHVRLSAALTPGTSAPSATAVGSGYTVDSINWYTDKECTTEASSFEAEKAYYGKIVLKPEKNYKFATNASALFFCDDPNENYTGIGYSTVAEDGSSLTRVVKGTAVSALVWEFTDTNDQTYTIGDSARTLNAKATGGKSGKPITYKLIAKKDGTETVKASATVAASVTDAFSAPLRFTDTGEYECWFEATRGDVTITSDHFTVTVNAPGLSITNQSGNLTVKQNATARLFVKAVGHGVKYEWQVKNDDGGWDKISGETAYDYAAPTDEAGEKTYQCKVTDKYGNEEFSNKMKVTVTEGTDMTITPAIPLAAVNGDAPDPAKLWPDKDVPPSGWLGLKAEYNVTAGETFNGVATFSTIPTGFNLIDHDIYYDSYNRVQKTPVLGDISYEWKGTEKKPWEATEGDFNALGTDAHASFKIPSGVDTYYVVLSVKNTVGEAAEISTVYITFHVSEAHEHTYAYAQFNESQHTKYCTAGDDSTKESHEMDNGVCKFCGYAPAKTYTVNVTNGTADPNADVTPGTKVTLTADNAPSGQEFDKWVGNVAVESDNTFTMPSHNVTVAATYKPITHTHTYGSWTKLNDAVHSRSCSAGDDMQFEDHKFNSWTDKNDGTHTSTCSECGYVKTANHNWVFNSQVDATFTAPGKTVYKCADNCGVANKEESIPKLNAISAVNVTVSAPIKDATPGTATTTDTTYDVAATDWEPSVSTFAGGTKYTVKVSLEARDNNRFTNATTFQINGKTATIVGTKPTATGVEDTKITLEFPATEGGSTSGGSSSGGGGGVTKYTVAVSPADNGKVTPDKTSAAKGSVVTITAMANDGYALDTIKATDKAGKEIKLTDKGDGKYTFTMPASKVEVKAAFKQTASKPGKPAEEMKTVVVMQVGSKTMFVNGKAYEKDAAPVIMNDRTLVPIRFVTESLGGTVAWNAETKEVTLVIDGKEIKMTIGKTIEKYGVAPVIIDSRTFVPVRFVADELGATTAWNAETKTVTITKAVTPVKTEK